MNEIFEYVPTTYVSGATGLANLTIRRWVKSGKLKGGRIGNWIVVERRAADELIASRARMGSPAEAGLPDAE